MAVNKADIVAPVTLDTPSSVPQNIPRVLKAALRLLSAIKCGMLDIQLPDGRVLRIRGRDDGPHGQMSLQNYGFLNWALRKGDIGVAEGFVAGHWTSPDLTSFLELFCHNAHIIHERIEANRLIRFALRAQHFLQRNTPKQARRNIAEHYDLGNAFYELWLDPSMTYSSGLWVEGVKTLAEAQDAKYKALADAAGIKAGQSVLEVGCGWGAFALYLAKNRDVHVTALTISQEQYDFAKVAVQRANLADRIDLRLQDYRDERGTYDAVVSIEMFEAVGQAYWPIFFERIATCLKPGGRAAMQVITIQEQYFPAYERGTDFIQQYVFPGGMLPTPAHLMEEGKRAGLTQINEQVFGLDYARTLRIWRTAFIAAWPQIEALRFDLRFKRLWLYYLHYCEAGFEAGNIDVRQVIYQRRPT